MVSKGDGTQTALIPWTRALTKFAAWSIFAFIILLYGWSLWALVGVESEPSEWQFSQTLHLIQISGIQALLSAILSCLFGLWLARAFFYLQFRGKNLLYQFISFAWALPSLVVIFAILGVWGKQGWLGQFLPSFYGLIGILLAHLFLNIPLATKYSLEALQLIPDNQLRLAEQLNFSSFSLLRWVELPYLKQSLPHTFGLVFLLCFTSFPIVLMLGGGPKYSTLEVAIYQAISFEFDFHKALHLIFVQAVIGIVLHLLLESLPKPIPQKSANFGYRLRLVRPWGLWFGLMLIGSFMLLPLLQILWQALTIRDFFAKLANPQLWQATLFSLLLSLIATFSVLVLAYLLALETRQQLYHKQHLAYQLLSASVMFPLLLPVFLLAVGLFVALMDTPLAHWQLLLLVGFCNGLILLPYIYRLLFQPLHTALVRYDKLAQHLNLTGFQRWFWVERPYLLRPVLYSVALAMSASLGSFAIIAFFGNDEFSSLPYLLYQQIGSYRLDDAAITALILLLLALLPFLLFTNKENPLDD